MDFFEPCEIIIEKEFAMPKKSLQLTNKRKEEVIDACEKLYLTKGYQEITIKEISKEISMSRPSIYNYYETKEEIFLALLIREYQKWNADILQIITAHEKLSPDELAHALSHTLAPRMLLLKISAMNLYEIEEHSRKERLKDYKVVFKESLDAFASCLKKFLPDLSNQQIEAIRYAFFPFMYGIYPYVYPTDKQKLAMDEAQVSYEQTTIEDITYNLLKQLIH